MKLEPNPKATDDNQIVVTRNNNLNNSDQEQKFPHDRKSDIPNPGEYSHLTNDDLVFEILRLDSEIDNMKELLSEFVDIISEHLKDCDFNSKNGPKP